MEHPINNIIQSRRSIYPHEFNGSILDASIIDHLLYNANFAPNHGSNYPWRFIVIQGSSLKNWIEEAASIYRQETSIEKFKQEKFDKTLSYSSKVSHSIALVMRRENDAKSVLIEDVCAVAAAVQNMYLSLAQYEHAGGYWSTGLGTYSSKMRNYLGLGENETLLGFFILGGLDHKRTESNRKDYKLFVRTL